MKLNVCRRKTVNTLERIKALKSDPAAIEKEAREQLHYTRPKEFVYVTPDPPQKPAVGRAKNE